MHSNPIVRAAVAAALLPSIFSVAHAQEQNVEEVIVTSTALRENPLAVAQPTTVVSGDQLHRQVAASLGETLSGELGVSSTYFGPSASQPVIRGLGGYRVQVLQDGAAALDVSSLSQDHAVSIEPVVSQQIEIIKGPAALLYGSGAAGGLINVVTTRVPSQIRAPISGALELRGDTALDERTGAFSVDGGGGLLAFHADYFDRSTDDVTIPGFAQSAILRRELLAAGEEPDGAHGRLPNSASDSNGGALGASLVGDAGFAGVSWNRYDSRYGIPAEDTAFIDMQQERIDAKGEWRAAGVWLDTLHFAGAHSDYTHTEFEAPGEPGTIFDQQAYELRVAADHHWNSDWRGTLGAQYVDTDFAATGDEAFVPASITRAASVFAFEERHFDAFTLELGARAENQQIEPANDAVDYDKMAINLSAGFVFKLQDDLALAINATRTQRHPQAAELFANGPHLAAGRVEIGDPTLDKETALTADVSLRAGGDGIRWTLNAFYNDYDDYIYANPTGAVEANEESGEDLPIYQYLQAPAKLYGYEAEVIFPVVASAGRTIEIRLASDYVRGKLGNGENLPQVPPLRLGAGLHFESDAWHVGLEAFRNLKQDDVITNELPTDAYTLVDLDVSYRLPIGTTNVLLFARGTNLLDEDARLATSPLKDIAPLPGRAAHFGVRVEL